MAVSGADGLVDELDVAGDGFDRQAQCAGDLFAGVVLRQQPGDDLAHGRPVMFGQAKHKLCCARNLAAQGDDDVAGVGLLLQRQAESSPAVIKVGRKIFSRLNLRCMFGHELFKVLFDRRVVRVGKRARLGMGERPDNAARFFADGFALPP